MLKIERGKSTTPDINLIISFEDILSAGMRELSISDEDAKPTGIKKGLMHALNPIDRSGNANGIVGPAPSRAGQREPRRYGSVYVGKLIRFDIVGGESRASEEAKVRQNLLLDIEANPATTSIAADGRNVGRGAC